jgi:hypothetical protein
MTKVAAFVLAGIILVWLARNWWQRRSRAQQYILFQRAVEEFPRQADLTERFLIAANATGKPRGLRWTSCELQGQPIFATNEATNEIFGLSGATIGFEAIPGGDMEEVEAVGDIRYVTAIFQFRNGEWQTDGRAIFNLEPAQALARLGETLKPKV